MGKAAIPEYLVSAAFHLERWLPPNDGYPARVVMDTMREHEFLIETARVMCRGREIGLCESIPVEDYFVCLQAGVFDRPYREVVSDARPRQPAYALRMLAEAARPRIRSERHAPARSAPRDGGRPWRNAPASFTGPCPDSQRLAGRFPAPDPRSYGP